MALPWRCLGFGFTGSLTINNDPTLDGDLTVGYRYVCWDGGGFGNDVQVVFYFSDSAQVLKRKIIQAIINDMANSHGHPDVTENDIIIQELAVIETRSQTDNYTDSRAGAALDISQAPLKYFSLQVSSVGGTATSWDVRLEGSLNGSDFTQILQHTNVTGEGAVLWNTVPSPCLKVRTRVSGVVLGTASNIRVDFTGSQ